VIAKLVEWKIIDKNCLIEPKNMPTKEHLLAVHTPEYLKSLNSSRTVAAITESTSFSIMFSFQLN
jgi:acetoin utilization deacetylase AcuC-like enzyme